MVDHGEEAFPADGGGSGASFVDEVVGNLGSVGGCPFLDGGFLLGDGKFLGVATAVSEVSDVGEGNEVMVHRLCRRRLYPGQRGHRNPGICSSRSIPGPLSEV